MTIIIPIVVLFYWLLVSSLLIGGAQGRSDLEISSQGGERLAELLPDAASPDSECYCSLSAESKNDTLNEGFLGDDSGEAKFEYSEVESTIFFESYHPIEDHSKSRGVFGALITPDFISKPEDDASLVYPWSPDPYTTQGPSEGLSLARFKDEIEENVRSRISLNSRFPSALLDTIGPIKHLFLPILENLTWNRMRPKRKENPSITAKVIMWFLWALMDETSLEVYSQCAFESSGTVCTSALAKWAEASEKLSTATGTYYEALDFVTDRSIGLPSHHVPIDEKQFSSKFAPYQTCQPPNVMFISEAGSVSTCPTERLKYLLQERQIEYGPIVKSTKRVYLYQLKKTKNKPITKPFKIHRLEFSDVVIATLGGRLFEYIEKWSGLESKMVGCLEKAEPEPKLDQSKQYFTYLLLDPLVSDLTEKRDFGKDLDGFWPAFLQSVFYIGKGKNSRPLDHLMDAFKANKSPTSEKIKKIKSIWAKGVGVVTIHVFHNISEAEALTREACMILALSNARLTNIQSGRCYGGVQKWTVKSKRQLGTVLLYRAMNMMLAEGVRQLYPSDLKK